MVFAAVAKSPCVFFVQNNEFAISVPLSRQTAAPSLAHKAVGYGLAIVFLTPWMTQGLAHLNNYSLAPVLLLIFFLIGVIADRN